MLEMVHYIPKTMKYVTYGATLSAARESGEHCKLPVGSGAELQWKSNLMHFSLKI